MDISQIEDTPWAKRFLAECPTEYREAIQLAKQTKWVTVERRDDHSSKGDFVWAVTPEIAPEFWLEAMKDKSDVLAVCKDMGWQVRKMPNK